MPFSNPSRTGRINRSLVVFARLQKGLNRFLCLFREKGAPPPESPANVGTWGETIALRHLEKEGFQVLARNWRSGSYELDLIALDKEVLVFIEVRTRSAEAKVPGYWSIRPRKRKALQKAALAYRKTLSRQPRTHRLDVVEIRRHNDRQYDLNHYRNVGWRPSKP